MKRILSWSILVGFAVAQMAIIAPKFITTGSETMYMAIVAPITGPDAECGKAMVDGVTLMIDTREESGALGDRDIQLIIKDDKSDPQTAMAHAATLAQDEEKSLATNILSKIIRFFEITPNKPMPRSIAG